jgi:hypothetical protein
VHPFFIRSAEFNKKIVILTRTNPPAERQEIERLNKEVMPGLVRESDSLYDHQNEAGSIRHLGFLKAQDMDRLSSQAGSLSKLNSGLRIQPLVRPV